MINPRLISFALLAVATAALVLGVVGCAMWTGHWRTDLPSSVYSDLIPRAGELSHP